MVNHLRSSASAKPPVTTPRDFTSRTDGQDKPALVFVHGWNCKASEWDGLAAKIKDLSPNQKVVAVSLPTFTDSPNLNSANFFDECAKRVSEACSSVSGPSLLIGHSMGGAVVAHYLSVESPNCKTPISGVYEIAGLKADPRNTLPSRNSLQRFGSAATRFLANAVYYFLDKFEQTHLDSYKKATEFSMRFMLKVFKFAAPILILLDGGSKAAARTFYEFTAEALSGDMLLSATALKAMCDLNLTPQSPFGKVKAVYAQHDVFICGTMTLLCAMNVYGSPGNYFSSETIPNSGHFPHREDPLAMAQRILEFASK
jgi:pimeloyl-ACP methyl ester carboxylesterase